jgi:hypothetical protein
MYFVETKTIEMVGKLMGLKILYNLGEIAAGYKVLQRALELVGSCEHNNICSGSIQGREFLD